MDDVKKPKQNQTYTLKYKENNPSILKKCKGPEHFAKGIIRMANRHKKRHSTSEPLRRHKLKPQEDTTTHLLERPI